MITYFVRLFLFSLMVTPLYSMDQHDQAIKKILPYENGRVACLNNDSVLINSPYESIIYNFKTGKTTDLCVPDHTLSMVHDPSKIRVLLLSCNNKPGVFNATIYDSQENQKYTWEHDFSCTRIYFGPSHNLLIETESRLASSNEIERAIFLYDYRTKSYKKEELKSLLLNEYFKKQLRLTGDNIKDQFCCSSDASYMAFIQDSHCCLMNLEKNILCVLEDKEGKFFCRALCMHPNNKHIVTMARDMSIHYWDITTRLCAAQQQSPIPIEKISAEQEENGFYNVLSLSANGKLLVVAFPTQCVVYHVPCDIVGSKTE